MLLFVFLLCFIPSLLGQVEDSQLGDEFDFDLGDFDLDIVRKFHKIFRFIFLFKGKISDLFCAHRLHAGSHGR